MSVTVADALLVSLTDSVLQLTQGIGVGVWVGVGIEVGVWVGVIGIGSQVGGRPKARSYEYGTRWWARLDSNQGPIGYEPTALPLSYEPEDLILSHPSPAPQYDSQNGILAAHIP